MSSVSQLLSALFLSLINLTVIVSAVTFKTMLGKDCVADAYKQVFSVKWPAFCAYVCTITADCQGFKMNGNDCHMFKYTKTSHRVNKDQTCAASDEIIWIKKESYKECPTGFGNEFYGSKYLRITPYKNQTDAIAHCKSLGDNSRLADAVDNAEMSHLISINTSPPIYGLWLDGAQIPGATEPAGGFKWTAAGVDIDPSLWAGGEPNNGGTTEHSVILHMGHPKLADYQTSTLFPSMCECNAVFN